MRAPLLVGGRRNGRQTHRVCRGRDPVEGVSRKPTAALHLRAARDYCRRFAWRDPHMKTAAPREATVSDADLRLGLRDPVGRLGKPTSPAELRKALPKPYQRPPADLTRMLADLARDGSLVAVKDGKGFQYVDRDPASVLAPAIQAALHDG